MFKFFSCFLLFSSFFLGKVKAEEGGFVARDFSSLLEMPDWNQSLLELHFKLYQGYVKNTNLLLSDLQKLREKGAASSYEFGALKRRLGWEFDGMKLHEFYFENLQKPSTDSIEESLLNQIKNDFGSFENWRSDFISTGLIRGIGWVILYKDPLTNHLYNVWINEHDVGHFVQNTPLLVMDVFEHAYITQFGLDRQKYIDLFFQSINWSVVNKRWKKS